MKLSLTTAILFLSLSLYSQQQLVIKGVYPNFYLVHNVSATDSYKSIAQLYNVSAVKLADYNKLTLHDGKIYAKSINIPLTVQNFTQKKIQTTQALVPIDYVLNPGETVNHVSVKYKLSQAALIDLNNLTSQQLDTRGKLTVGFLRVLPDMASKFKIQEKNPVVKATPDNEEDGVAKIIREQKQQQGVRTAKSRNDTTATKAEPTAAEKAPETVIISKPVVDSTVVAVSMAAAPPSNRLKVFIDCNNTGCDNTFIKTEINIVDFLLDRVASDVHMLITSQRNGSGGSQFQMIFYGQNKYKNLADTLRFNIDPNATESERRDVVLKYIKLGLIPFLSKTDYANDVNIQMKRNELDKDATSNANTKDKWNYWVFRAGANGNISLQEVYKSTRFNGNFSANRTTDKLKTGFSTNAGQSIERYFDDSTGEKIETIQNSNYQVEHFLVKSLNERWSAGYELSISSSTFSNNKSRINFGAGIEYAIFPYKEVNNKFFTINYSINLRKNKYYDSTIYFKIEEKLIEQEASINLSLKQKWGTISSNAEYSSYLHNTKLNSISIDLNVDVRITGGLSVYGYMSAARVNDQINLLKGSATALQVLTRQRELASKFRFYSGFGLSYRFGSKLNNFVNPRFDN